jgi:hypothetical protein
VIPSCPDDVTAAWLSRVLSVEGRPVVVLDTELTPIGTGQTGATYRVSVSYAGSHPDLPDTFVVKLPSQDPEVRVRVVPGYRAEHAFYTRVASTVAVPIPQCYYCEIGADGGEFALLVSDMAPAVQGDQIAGCSAWEAELAVRALAGLHGPRWCDPESFCSWVAHVEAR